jgi:hypothetical protein
VAQMIIPFQTEKLVLLSLARLMHNKHSNYETCRPLRRCFPGACIICFRHSTATVSIQTHAAV